MEGGYRAIVSESVFPTDDAEAKDVTLIVEDLEALGAVLRGQTGDDVYLTESADIAIANDDMATLDEVLVSLRIIEAADDRPDGGDGSSDLLYDGGAALVGTDGVYVVACDGVRYGGGRMIASR